MMVLLPSPSSFYSPRDRPMNRRQGVEARNRTLFGKPADWEDGRLKSYKKKPSSQSLHARFFYRTEMGQGERGEVRKQSQKDSNLANFS